MVDTKVSINVYMSIDCKFLVELLYNTSFSGIDILYRKKANQLLSWVTLYPCRTYTLWDESSLESNIRLGRSVS